MKAAGLRSLFASYDKSLPVNVSGFILECGHIPENLVFHFASSSDH